MTNTAPATPSIPHNREAEEAVLGSVLINPEEALPLAAGILTAEDFYIQRHRWIWEACLALRERKVAIDMLTLSEELDRRGNLAEMGGPAYLTALINQVPTSLHAEEYARIVAAHALRRRMIKAANELARLAYDESIDVDSSLGEAEKLFRDLTVSTADNDDPVPVEQVIGQIYDRLDRRLQAQQAGAQLEGPRTNTHLADLNPVLKGGLLPGAVYVVAGRPGQGKSSFLQTLIYNTAVKDRKKVLAASAEMSNPEVVGRLLAIDTGVQADVYLEKLPVGDQWEKLTAAMETFSSKGKILLLDAPGMTISRLRSKALRVKARFGLDLLTVDYLQLMRSGIRANNREQEVAYISRELKILAGELGVPVLVAAQLSRAVEQRNGKRPQLSDLRESGAIENDADVVMFIWRPDEIKSPKVSQICVDKHRGGPLGEVDLYFNTKITRFENLAKERS